MISVSGRLDNLTVPKLWETLPADLKQKPCQQNLVIDLSGLTGTDDAAAAFLSHIESQAISMGYRDIEFKDLAPDVAKLLKSFKKSNISLSDARKEDRLSFIENQGRLFSDFLSDAYEFIAYMGEITWALAACLVRPSRIRWADTVLVAEKAGVNALGIVALISFIVGLVMAFQAAIPMRMFGAELYVANLIGIAMVRELGPLMTAIVLAGRSASAFAAEIGTMRINEEIDALQVMGLNPIRFLVIPRIIALTLITPLLTVFSNLVGIIGGAVVITSMGYPVISYYQQVAGFVQWNDFVGGLVKCLVFGILIAATGCIRGYQTGSGPSAVGDSTTRAVVLSIILVAVFDGIFSIVYYYLGI